MQVSAWRPGVKVLLVSLISGMISNIGVLASRVSAWLQSFGKDL